MWWFLFAIISFTDGYLFIEPKFKTQLECVEYLQENVMWINSYVNQQYDFPDIKINPIVCISEKDWKDMSGEGADT